MASIYSMEKNAKRGPDRARRVREKLKRKGFTQTSMNAKGRLTGTSKTRSVVEER